MGVGVGSGGGGGILIYFLYCFIILGPRPPASTVGVVAGPRANESPAHIKKQTSLPPQSHKLYHNGVFTCN